MRFPEYDQQDAIGLAALIRDGEVSAQEVLEAAIERIDGRNPALNAVVHKLYDRARARVDALPDGPLRGVPFLLKDLKLALAGTPTSDSCQLTRDYTPKQSSVLAERYEAAGLQIVGKTNTPEFGLMGITESRLRGPCRNPWNTDHTPGGSSGGSASAVAARMVPIAHAGDGGGSIRIPASHCGLVGLKPTRGRVTMAPFRGEAWCGFVQEHVVSRSVRDAALLLDIAAVDTPGDPYPQPPKARPWLDEVGAPAGKLRIAFTRDTLYAGETHADCAAAVDDAVQLLRELGHDVEEAKPALPVADLIRAYFVVVAAGIGVFTQDAAAKAGVPMRGADFEPASWLFSRIGRTMSATDLVIAQNTMHAAGRTMASFMERYDLFLTSATARPPALVGELYPKGAKELQIHAVSALPFKALIDVALDGLGKSTLAATPNTQVFNQTGQPAISVPLHWNAAGLPIGVQLGARYGDEATLIRVAAQLEQARPWANRAPPGL